MSKLGFHIVKLWVRFLSIHPYWLLYLKSDCYYFLLYYVFRYRRKVVRQNLLHSFPEKGAKEIKAIEAALSRGERVEIIPERNGVKLMRLKREELKQP